MRRLSILLTTAFFTFVIGVSANALINSFITDEVVETISTCSNYESAVMVWREPKLIPPAVHSCGHFVITVGDDRQPYFNSRWIGSLDDSQLLIKELEDAFRARTDNHLYRRGMESA